MTSAQMQEVRFPAPGHRFFDLQQVVSVLWRSKAGQPVKDPKRRFASDWIDASHPEDALKRKAVKDKNSKAFGGEPGAQYRADKQQLANLDAQVKGQEGKWHLGLRQTYLTQCAGKTEPVQQAENKR